MEKCAPPRSKQVLDNIENGKCGPTNGPSARGGNSEKIPDFQPHPIDDGHAQHG
jgi:hypothetical protein